MKRGKSERILAQVSPMGRSQLVTCRLYMYLKVLQLFICYVFQLRCAEAGGNLPRYWLTIIPRICRSHEMWTGIAGEFEDDSH